MNLVKYNTAAETFPRLFDSFWMKDMDNFVPRSTGLPATNLLETDEAYGIELVAPGLQKEAFNLVLENNQLKVSYKAPEQTEEGLNKRFTLREFNVQEFTKVFSLPKDKVQEEAVTAIYEAGILHITLPKKEEAKPKQPVAIQVN